MSKRLIDRLSPLLEEIGEAYFVGGCVRDWLMGRPLKDIDLATIADPWQVGRKVADPLGAYLFWLREEQRVARVLRPGPGGFQVDLSPLAGTIEADLEARDFTVNAMAVPVASGLLPEAPVIDPTGGQADLERHLLRLVGDETLARDPLRLMRAVRLSEQLRFRLDPETESAVRVAAPTLAAVSPERVRDELFLMLSRGNADRALDRLRAFGLLAVILPESATLSPATWSITRARVRTLHAITRQRSLPGPLRRRLRAPVTEPRSRAALLKWGALLAAVRPADMAIGAWTRLTGTRVRLGARETACLAALLREEPAAAALLQSGVIRGRDVYRFVRSAGEWAIEAALFAAGILAADYPRSARVPGLVPVSLSESLEGIAAQEADLASPLLSGVEVMSLLGLEAGPAVGRWLEALAEARALGEIASPEDAGHWLLVRAKSSDGETT